MEIIKIKNESTIFNLLKFVHLSQPKHCNDASKQTYAGASLPMGKGEKKLPVKYTNIWSRCVSR